jgi:hypothetical protein
VRRLPILAALLVLAAAVPTVRAAELYGRPLRGLTAVPIAELAKRAAEFDGKTIRVRGQVRAEDGAFRLAEGDAAVRVVLRDRGGALPGDASGATATAEGTFRAKGAAGDPALEATGVEIAR